MIAASAHWYCAGGVFCLKEKALQVRFSVVLGAHRPGVAVGDDENDQSPGFLTLSDEDNDAEAGE